jgi:glycerol uptake facilitator protein
MNVGLVRACLGEIVGTFILVFFGCGAVHSAVLLNGLTGLWQVGIVWGLAIMLAAYTVGSVSGAHLNPAVSIALAAWGRFSWSRVLPYIAAQLVGAILAAATLFVLFRGPLTALEAVKSTPRGSPNSFISAMCYGEYFPNPGGLATGEGPFNVAAWRAAQSLVSHKTAFTAEVIGTALLAFVVFATTDGRNRGAPAERFAPVFIGLTVTALICVLAPLTQACFNPARDFGPRLFAYFAGWGSAAIPGPNGIGFLTVYVAAPILGGLIGSGLYEKVIADNKRIE